jgi:hypothetical protein
MNGGKEMRKIIITALLLACGVTQANPQWAPVAITNNGKMQAFVDLGSIRVSGNTRHALFKYVYAPHSQKDERVGKWNKVSFGEEAFNCTDETSRIEALSVHYEDGTDWSQPADQLPTSWTLIGPDTLRDHQRHFICAGVPK